MASLKRFTKNTYFFSLSLRLLFTKYHMSLFLSLRKSFCLPPLSFHNIVAKFYSTSKIFCCKFFLLRALNLVVPKTCWTYDGAPAGGALSTLLYFNPLHLYGQHQNTRPQELSKRYRVCPSNPFHNIP